jgi:hypothetical protein
MIVARGRRCTPGEDRGTEVGAVEAQPRPRHVAGNRAPDRWFTAPPTGCPGAVLTINVPGGTVPPDMLRSTLTVLRVTGAEAVRIGGPQASALIARRRAHYAHSAQP